MRRAIFKLKMKFSTFTLVPVVALALLAFSCNNSPKVRTYQDAENEFLASLTEADTFAVLALGQEFMQNLMAGGDIDKALASLTVLEYNVLYKVGDSTIEELKDRYSKRQVTDYACVRYSFSTPGNNDLVYRYSTGGKLGAGPGMKLVFNPVKVEDHWYLTLKDAYQSSLDIAEDEQVHPLSPAPDPLRLNRKETDN